MRERNVLFYRLENGAACRNFRDCCGDGVRSAELCCMMFGGQLGDGVVSLNSQSARAAWLAGGEKSGAGVGCPIMLFSGGLQARRRIVGQQTGSDRPNWTEVHGEKDSLVMERTAGETSSESQVSRGWVRRTAVRLLLSCALRGEEPVHSSQGRVLSCAE